MTPAMVCPENGCDLDGGPIPDEYLALGYYAEGVTRYTRTIGVTIPGLYDGVAYFVCPDCGHRWHRFPEGDYRRSRVRGYWNAWDLRTIKGALGR